MKLPRCLLCLVSLSIIAACSDDGVIDDGLEDDDDLEVDEAVVNAANWENWSSGAVYATTDPFVDPYYFDDGAFLTLSTELPEDAEAAAVLVADNAGQYYTPADCAQVERNGSQLTYTLSGCSGPFDEATLDGTLIVSLSDQGDQIAFELVSEELEIDGQDATLSANGVYSATGSSRTVQYTSQRTLTGADEFAGEFDTTLTWTAGSNCVTRNGTGQVMTESRNLDVTFDGFTRCAGACPTAGTVTVADDDDDARLTFEGRNEATLDRADGERDQVDLDCD